MHINKFFVGLKLCFLEFSSFLLIEVWGVTQTMLRQELVAVGASTDSCSASIVGVVIRSTELYHDNFSMPNMQERPVWQVKEAQE
jgi:hypothetical protein